MHSTKLLGLCHAKAKSEFQIIVSVKSKEQWRTWSIIPWWEKAGRNPTFSLSQKSNDNLFTLAWREFGCIYTEMFILVYRLAFDAKPDRVMLCLTGNHWACSGISWQPQHQMSHQRHFASSARGFLGFCFISGHRIFVTTPHYFDLSSYLIFRHLAGFMARWHYLIVFCPIISPLAT